MIHVDRIHFVTTLLYYMSIDVYQYDSSHFT